MLAEQCNRFEEMIEFLEQMLKARDNDLNSDERNLLSITYKNAFSTREVHREQLWLMKLKKKRKINLISYLIFKN
jgi:hypothetical protein